MWDGLDPRDADGRERDASDPRDAEPIEPRDVFTQGLALPHGLERERVHSHDRDYQLRGSEVRTLATIGAFRVVPADDHELPMTNDRVQFPDVRIEYERPDGRRDVEDVEVTTLNYRGAHAAGKVQAGFTRFRGSSARVGGSGASGRATSFDPRVAEE